MAEGARSGAPQEDPRPHEPPNKGLSAADGRLDERRGGKQQAARGVRGPGHGRFRRCVPVTLTGIEISPAAERQPAAPYRAEDSYLVDSASSHMLVSKIKPCMSKYKQLYSETANGSLYKLSFI
jgi:hypothetical protein